jgi:acetyl-CoA C-acetyltransferase
MKGRSVYVVDGARVPFLKAGHAPGPFAAAGLALRALQPLLLRQPFAPDAFDDVILGCVMPGPREANIARVVSLRAGCGDKTPAWTVQRNCGSGMQALDCAARAIAAGRAGLVLAGGVEAMSHAPLLYSLRMAAWFGRFSAAKRPMGKLAALKDFRPAYLKPVIGLLCGLTDPTVGLSMGQTAEVVARRFGITREEMDAYAVQSHKRLAAATDSGRLEEMEPLIDGKGGLHDHDEGLRPDSSVEKLAKLRPVFDRKFGMVTAGNSSQITDGAAWLILASAAMVKRHKLEPLGRIIDCAWAGNDPRQMGLGPVYAMTELMADNDLALKDVDYWELNEAFAAQVLGCLRAWKDKDFCASELGMDKAMGEVPMERLNVDGGAVSLGHPVGASGARIVLHLLHVLRRNGAKRGIASQCIGGGQGGAMLVEAS